MTLTLRYAAQSDRGLIRDGNQDSVYAGPRLLAVADGMGGMAAGDVASNIVIAAMAPLDEDVPGDALVDALRHAVGTANQTAARHRRRQPAAGGDGHHADRGALLRQQDRHGAHRRLARLPAAPGRVRPDHQGRHLRPDAGRRGPDQPGGGEQPPAAVAAHPGARRPRHRPGVLGPPGAQGRPLPDLQRRPLRRGQRRDHRREHAGHRRPAGVRRAAGAARAARRRPGQHHRGDRRRDRRGHRRAGSDRRRRGRPRPRQHHRRRRLDAGGPGGGAAGAAAARPQPEGAAYDRDEPEQPKRHPVRTSAAAAGAARHPRRRPLAWAGSTPRTSTTSARPRTGQLAIFRGVPGQIAGLDLSSVARDQPRPAWTTSPRSPRTGSSRASTPTTRPTPGACSPS